MEEIQAVKNLLAYCMAAAIPVVAFSLWTEYFARYLMEELKDNRALDQDRELRRLRGASLYTLCSQAVIYLASAPLRIDYWGIAAMVFAGSLLIQQKVLANTERDLFPQKSEKESKSAVGVGFRMLLWNLTGIAAYLFLVQACALGFAMASHALGLPQHLGLTLTLVGGLLGIVGGLILTFGLAPLQIRKSMESRIIEDPELKNLLKSCFKKAEIRELDCYMVETPIQTWNNAWVAGFTGGRGVFRPGMFFTQSLLRNFTLAELEAVVLHEVSHIRLRHLKKRFFYTIRLLMLSSLILTAVGAAAVVMLPPGARALPILPLAIAALFIPMRKIRELVGKQEFEADRFTVTHLGLDPVLLISVLEKLSRVNQVPGAAQTTQPSASGHPTLEERIQAISKLVQAPAADQHKDAA
jgi:Zn-dependent protease with chaperone function